MSKTFRPSKHESTILSKIESSKEYARKKAIKHLNNQDLVETLSNGVAMHLIDSGLVETTSKNTLQEQIHNSLEKLSHADDFDVDYMVSPFRNLVPQPNVVSLYLTAVVIEQLINHKDVVDIFGSDEDIYNCIDQQTKKHLPL
jgi:hypothetical protein